MMNLCPTLHEQALRMGGILIDTTRLLSRFIKGRLPTGVDRVCLAYIRRYESCARVFLHKGGIGGVLSQRASRDIFELLLDPAGDFFRVAGRLSTSLLPRQLRNGERDCFLFNMGHSGLESRSYAQWLAGSRTRPIFMVHDLIPITHPEYCRSGEHLRHAARMKMALKSAAGIVANSKETLRELAEFADASGLAMPPAVAAPIGGADLPGSSAPSPVAGPYFVMLGTIEPRKNHMMVLQVWRRLVETGGRAAPKLVLIGRRGWDCENVSYMLERCTSLKDFVTELPKCSDSELSCYLRHARALVFPSFAEGYGLPLIEALSVGLPVIASSLPVFREIAGVVPDYLDPLDGTGWLDAIRDYTQPGSPRRAAQIKRMAGFTPPDWRLHFDRVEDLLGQLG